MISTHWIAFSARIRGWRRPDLVTLHAATDSTGHFSNGPTIVNRLITAGAEVDAPSRLDGHTETPLHWAASNNDVAVLDVLLDAGANINAPGAVLA